MLRLETRLLGARRDPLGLHRVALAALALDRALDRVAYVHFKDIDPAVKAEVVASRTGFYEACGQGIFCNLGKGVTDFQAVRTLLLDAGYQGWCTVEQDCDPAGPTSPVDDARANRSYLSSIGFN